MPDYTPPRRPSAPFPEEAARRAHPYPPRIARPGQRPVLPVQRPVPPAPPVQRPAAAAPAAAPAAVAAEAEPAAEESKPDLTVTKVIAGAGAAATSAVMGSYLGAAGTVGGAALGSVVSVVGASLYQHYLDRTRDTVRARIRLPGGRTVSVTEQVEVPAPRSALGADAAPTQVLVTPVAGTAGTGRTGPAPGGRPGDRNPLPAAAAPVVAPRRSGGRWVMAGAAVALAFLIGMLAVTGIEWLKGSTLNSGESGTSVGRVIEGNRSAPSTEENEPGTANDEDTNEKTTDAPSETTSSSEPSSTSDGTDRSATRAPDSTGRSTTTTTESPAPTTYYVVPGR